MFPTGCGTGSPSTQDSGRALPLTLSLPSPGKTHGPCCHLIPAAHWLLSFHTLSNLDLQISGDLSFFPSIFPQWSSVIRIYRSLSKINSRVKLGISYSFVLKIMWLYLTIWDLQRQLIGFLIFLYYRLESPLKLFSSLTSESRRLGFLFSPLYWSKCCLASVKQVTFLPVC